MAVYTRGGSALIVLTGPRRPIHILFSFAFLPRSFRSDIPDADSFGPSLPRCFSSLAPRYSPSCT